MCTKETYIGQDGKGYAAITNQPEIPVIYYNKGLFLTFTVAHCESRLIGTQVSGDSTIS